MSLMKADFPTLFCLRTPWTELMAHVFRAPPLAIIQTCFALTLPVTNENDSKNQAGVMFSVSRCLDCIAIHRRVSCFVPCNSKHSLIPSIWVHTHSNNPHSSSISPDVLATNVKSFTASVDKNRWNAYRYFRDSRFARVISFLRCLVYFKIDLQRRNFFTINPTNDRLKKNRSSATC